MTIPTRVLPLEGCSHKADLSMRLDDVEPQKDQKSQFSLFDQLPGEIRNQIFEYCVQNASKPIKGARWLTNQTQTKDRELSIQPRWNGPVRIRMSGIGSLPLIWVNKRTNYELASLVYSKVESVRIGGYILRHPNENPTLIFNQINATLMNPHIRQFAQNIKLKLPSTREDLHRMSDSLRGFSITGFLDRDRLPNFEAVFSVIPTLVETLKLFESLETLEIVITVEMTSPPDFEPLLPLYDLCGNRSGTVFVSPYDGNARYFRTPWWQWTERWDMAWKDCLVRNRRA
jgi:hypothetical protein